MFKKSYFFKCVQNQNSKQLADLESEYNGKQKLLDLLKLKLKDAKGEFR